MARRRQRYVSRSATGVAGLGFLILMASAVSGYSRSDYFGYVLAGIGIALWVWALRTETRALVHRDRDRLGLCRACGYNLTGNTSGVCPECGTPIPSKRA